MNLLEYKRSPIQLYKDHLHKMNFYYSLMEQRILKEREQYIARMRNDQAWKKIIASARPASTSTEVEIVNYLHALRVLMTLLDQENVKDSKLLKYLVNTNGRGLEKYFDEQYKLIVGTDDEPGLAYSTRVQTLGRNLRNHFNGFKRRVYKLRRRLERRELNLSRLASKLNANGANQQRSKWNADYRRYVNLAIQEFDFTGDANQLNDRVAAATSAVILRGLNKANRSHESYDWKSVVRINIDPLPGVEGKFAVGFEDSQRGQSESIIAIIAKAYGIPELTSQLKGLDLNINLEDKRNFEAWKVLAQTFAANKLLPMANNGSKCLVQFETEQGQLSQLCKLLDAMAEDISSAAVYLLGLVNGSNENILGLKESLHEPLNGQDEHGRRIITVVYDSNRTVLLKNPDGSGATNFNTEDNIGQTRFWLINGIEDGVIADNAKGLFAKGQQYIGKFTVVDDGNGNLKMFSVEDLINLAELDADEVLNLGYTQEEFETLEYCVNFYSDKDETALYYHDRALYYRVLDNKHFWQHPGCTVEELVNARLLAWTQLFNRNIEMPWVVGLEVGQVKCRAKNEFSFVAKTNHNDIKEALKASSHGIVELDGDLYGCVIIKSPSDKISRTSLNYQPMSYLVSRHLQKNLSLEEVYANYCVETDAMLETFNSEAFNEDQKVKFDRFIEYLNLQDTPYHKNGKVLLKNFKSSLWRWFTNFNKTYQPTRRVLMHDMGYRGFCIVNNDFDCRIGQVAQQRGPLISPLALQANVYINRKVACRLLQEIKVGEISDRSDKQIGQIRERMLLRNGLDSVSLEMISDFLKEVIRISTVVTITDALVLMHPKDVEDMQGDDDGDTVTVDRDPEVVATFAATEIFWKEIFTANDVGTIELEQPKEMQIVHRNEATRWMVDFVRNDGNVSPLNSEAIQAIEQYGIEAPNIAKYFGLTGTKIPNILGFTFAEFYELNEATYGMFTEPENFAMLANKLSSNPAGPIGAPSNCAPDLMIKALNNMDKNNKFTKEGKFMFEGYKNSASQLQISLDFIKRIVEIINSFLVGTEGYPDFSKQLKAEDIQNFLVKNTFSEVTLLQINSELYNVAKTVRVFASDVSSPIKDHAQWLYDADPYKVYIVSKDDLNRLKKTSIKDVIITSKKVNIRDEDNYCFDFGSIYSFSEFILSVKYPGMKPAVWKTNLDEILGDKKEEVNSSFAVSSWSTALVENARCFLRYHDSSDYMKHLLEITPRFIAFAKESKIGVVLDPLYSKVSVTIGKFFSEEYSFTRKVASPRKVLKAVFDGYGIPEFHAQILKSGGTVKWYDTEINIFDIIVSMARNDVSYKNQDIPQTAWQMLLEEYLSPEEDSELFKTLVPVGVDSALKDIELLNGFPANGRKKSMASVPTNALRYFGDKFKATLIKNGWIIEQTDLARKTQYYSWASPQGSFFAAALAMKSLKQGFIQKLADPGNETLSNLAFSEINADPFKGAQEVLKTIKATFRKYDDIIKYLNALGKMTVVPVCPFVAKRHEEINGNFSEPQSNALFAGMPIAVIGHSANLYATNLDSINVFNKLANDNFVYDPQVNRLSQWEIVKYIASQGHYIKSFSYFGNSSWKDPKTILFMHKFQQNELTLDSEVMQVQKSSGFHGEKPILTYISEMNFLKVIGLEKSKAFKVLLKTNRIDQHYYNVEGMSKILELQPTGLCTRVVWKDPEILLPYVYSNEAWKIYSATLKHIDIKDMEQLASELASLGIQVDKANPKCITLLGKQFYSTQKIVAYFSQQLAFNK